LAVRSDANHPVDVENIVAGLRLSLETIVSEDNLLLVITERVTTLRESFPSHRRLFTPSHIEFLKSLAPVSDRLRSFIEVKEELVDVGTLAEYNAMVSRLTEIKGALGALPVRKRVMKEIRGLNERLPAIRERDGATRQARADTRIFELNQDPRHCRRNHAMVIRNGPRGYFWGCSRYPFCVEMARLTPAEKDRLLP
jgi:hypothetical protein